MAKRSSTSSNTGDRARGRAGSHTGRRAASIEAADTRGRTLVIVESPAKARTINRYLGDDYVVRASMGHVRDLPARDFGVDLSNNFAPTYVTTPERTHLVSQLKRMADHAAAVFLATDLDREGEAIAWHLAESLGIPPDKAQRVIFNQITKDAIRVAFSHPHAIDMDKVNAQQARRILDRIVGYQVSPLLWRRIRRGLSAGRVQTVAVRVIVEREREIRAFLPEEYWEIAVELNPDSGDAGRKAGEALAVFLGNSNAGKGPAKKDLYSFYEQHHLLRAELVNFDGEKFRPNIAPNGIVELPKAAMGSLSSDSQLQKDPLVKWNPYLSRMLIDGVRGDADYGVLAAAFGVKQREPSGNKLPCDQAIVLALDQYVESVAAALGQAKYRVASMKTTQQLDRPPGPFTTASLQQAAVNQLGMTASQAMRLAQQLYEGVELEQEGSVGLITYMRTDSLNLAPEAVAAARTFIGEQFGEKYVPEQPNKYAAAAGAQEAHEAIRPTGVTRTPQSLRGQLPQPMWRLYDLIWRRFVACQMAPAIWEKLTIDVEATCVDGRKGLLRASGRKLLFEGHLAVAGRRETVEPVIPSGIVEGAPLWPARVEPSQHFTEPPPRYTEASLVKALESEGIGRPSTYAAIIDTIQARGYVELKDRKFFPLPIGEVVADQLVAAFPKIFDVEFTRFMESELDRIEAAHADWVTILREFYEPFSQCLAKAGEVLTKPVEKSEYKCPKCNKDVVYRIGRTGRFLGCTGYPDCDFTANVDAEGKMVEPKQIDTKCPECGKPMVFRTSKRGPFLGCTSYPECSGTLPCDEQGQPLKVVEPSEVTASCPECGSPMQVRFARGRAFMGCSTYPQCKATAQLPPGVTVRVPKSKAVETGVKCEKCDRPMVVRVSRRGPFLACTGFPRCRNARNLSKLEREAVEAGRFIAAPMPDEGAGPPESGRGDAETAAPGRREEGKTGKKQSNRLAATRSRAAAEGSASAERTPATEGSASPGVDSAGSTADPSAIAASSGGQGGGHPLPANVPAGAAELGELIKAGCPTCGGPVTLRTSRFGPFLGCARYPTCKTIVKIKGEAIKQARVALGLPEKAAPRPKPQATTIPCSKCGELMVIRNGSSGQFLGCSKYPKCKNTAPLPVELTGLKERQ